ncbi:hypothetical protein CPB86DRAFT_870615 [Serendipita vermifera]|nr:hypothetical protein CPB86DRAFT_870615 [Serendipita vermifera]
MSSASRQVSKRRGPISCAECRRLKIKCDRIVPCGPCQRRGCASLCPDGSLVSKGSRYILSDTEALHRRVEELILRVRELEKGLEDERASHSLEPHPLLNDSLLSIAAPPTQEDHNAEAENGPISTFGTLMITDDGTRMKWLGSTAVAAWFLEDSEEEAADFQPSVEQEVEESILDLCNNFPFGTVQGLDAIKDKLYNYLPQEESEAMFFVERFFQDVGWLYNFVPKKGLDEMVRILYDPSAPALPAHRLAIIFMVFALTTWADPHPKPQWHSTYVYSQLARAALGAESVFGTTATLATVQALCLLSLWYQLLDDQRDPAKSWGCLGLTFKVAQSIGLHRDGRTWGMSEEDIMDRRRVFWELQALDVWQALGYGRPPSMMRPHFDTPQPFDTEESLGHPPHFHRWKHHYTSEGIMNILDQVLITNSNTIPPHSIVLKLDTKIRSCTIPAKIQLKDAGARSQADDMLLLQHFTSMLSKESALMYLHRGFFARAVFDPPHDPLRHKFAHSVLAVYTSAGQILKWFKELVYSYPHILSRVFGWWGHAYSSAVTLGGLVTMAPGCNLADQALREFDMAIETLNKGTVGPNARRILPALQKLQVKAHQSHQMYRTGQWNPEAKKGPPPPEMPGLGTAMLPLANKTQSPSPPKDKESPQSPNSIGKGPDPPSRSVKEAHLRTPSERWTISSTESQDFAMPISPQDLIAQQNLNTMASFASHPDSGRPCSRAQSFDDFLRLHRLQDQGMPSQAMSAPTVISSLPQSSQQLPPTDIHSPPVFIPW